jgi:uncharacterized RDD family membrane protein YckC
MIAFRSNHIHTYCSMAGYIGVPFMAIATIWRRIGAFLLDYLVISAYLIVLVMVGVGLGFGPLQNTFQILFANPDISELSAFVLLVLPVLLYFTLFERSPWQATWGKRMMRLQVTTLSGTRLSFARSLGRSCLKLIPWELTHACLWRIPGWPTAPTSPSTIITIGLILVWVLIGAYAATMFIGKKRQALYDWIAGTIVVSTARRTSHPNEKEL